MTVHTDHTHHHPHVYKELGFWQAWCPRCGPLQIHNTTFDKLWRCALVAALVHSKTFS